jgi:hypothetical protein
MMASLGIQSPPIHLAILIMNRYGFTFKTDSGDLVSWVVDAPSRKDAFNQLQCGDKPDQLLILTCKLSEAQEYAWVNACVEHGGFDDQMAISILQVY